VLSLIVSVPELEIPPPDLAEPLRIVIFERVTWALTLETVTTVPACPPSIVVVRALAPITFKLIAIVRFSV
jgi:hypothetical protein